MSEEKKPIVVGTYNMSFASDKALDAKFPSERFFLNRMKLPDENGKDGVIDRRYWKNALKHLIKFIEVHTPLAVGLQEMNRTKEGDKHKEGEGGEEYGTYAVEKMLPDGYKIISRDVETNNAGVSLIVNTELAGDITDENNIMIKDNSQGPGRPILMALTDKNILLVSMHGMQNPSNGRDYEMFNKNMKEGNKEELESLVKTFLGDRKPVAAYVMGDFNDRYDAITEFDFGKKDDGKDDGK